MFIEFEKCIINTDAIQTIVLHQKNNNNWQVKAFLFSDGEQGEYETPPNHRLLKIGSQSECQEVYNTLIKLLDVKNIKQWIEN